MLETLEKRQLFCMVLISAPMELAMPVETSAAQSADSDSGADSRNWDPRLEDAKGNPISGDTFEFEDGAASR